MISQSLVAGLLFIGLTTSPWVSSAGAAVDREKLLADPGVYGTFAVFAALGPVALGQSHGHSGGSHHHRGSGGISPVTINPNPGAPNCRTYWPGPPVLLGWGSWLPGPVAPVPLAPIAPTVPVGLPAMPPLWQPTADPWPTVIPLRATSFSGRP